MNPLFDSCLILTGPTGSGKSALALRWAEDHHGEIISMDSMTLYRGMDIGTAKPSLETLARVPHHLIDCLDPWEGASVAWWLAEAARAVTDIQHRGKRPIIVGGTPLYLKAMIFGLFEGPPEDPALRARLEALSAEELQAQLREVDAKAAARLHVNDHKRLVRALEVYLQTGQTLSALQQQFEATPRERPFPILCIDWPRAELYRRINQRVDEMLAAGWLEETRRLLALPQPLSRQAAQAAGYAELIAHLRGECTLVEAIDRIKTRTRQLAKRQLTWFRHFPGLAMVTLEQAELRGREWRFGCC